MTMRARTFQSIASLSLASSFFFSSASTLDGALASLLSFASAPGVASSPLFVSVASFFSVVAAWSLYHLVLADGVVRKGFKGAVRNCGRAKGRCATGLALDEIALEDVANARRNIMTRVTTWVGRYVVVCYVVSV